MKWHELIFSKKSPDKYIRHLAFWVAWCLYLLSGKYLLPQVIPTAEKGISVYKLQYIKFTSHDLFQSSLILLVLMTGCYAFINILLPKFFLRAKYLMLLLTGILLCTGVIMATHFIQVVVMPFIDSSVLNNKVHPDKMSYWFSISNGGINFIKIIIAASVIKIARQWWLKQKEMERLEKEKIDTELQLLKAQIHPGFLFNTLKNIYSSAKMASPKAPEMLMKLSEILSYMLYECNEREVSLAKEIKMLKDYMALEKIRFGDTLEMNIMVKGPVSEEKIVPLLLLHFIENSFIQCSHLMTEQPWINLEMKIENHELVMKLMNGKPAEMEIAGSEEDGVQQAQRRLELLYRGRHELSITDEPEIMMVVLKINLQELPEINEPLTGRNIAIEVLEEIQET